VLLDLGQSSQYDNRARTIRRAGYRANESEDEMIGQFKPGDVIDVPLWRDDALRTESAELLPRLIVWFYDGTGLAAPPVKGIDTVEEAIRIVRERCPSAHFANELDASCVGLIEGTMDRDALTIAIPFYAAEQMEQTPDSQADAAGVIEWFARLKR
jgi:hypothetical protein